jgi:hypothetical protein
MALPLTLFHVPGEAVAAALADIGQPGALREAEDGSMAVQVPSVGMAMAFAAALTARLLRSAWSPEACCALEVMGRASDSWVPSEDRREPLDLRVEFPAIVLDPR